MTTAGSSDRVVLLPLHPEPGPRSNPDKVASYVRSMIFHGHLRHGDRIRQDDLAATLGVSRIPVREALIALDREGWITSEPHRGAFVNGLDRTGVEDHYRILGLVYRLAAEHATHRATADDLAALTAQVAVLKDSDSVADFAFENERLLRMVFRLAGSPRLTAVTRVMTSIVPGNFFEAVPEALPLQRRALPRIVKAIATRDATSAAAQLDRLFARHGNLVVRALAERGLLIDT